MARFTRSLITITAAILALITIGGVYYAKQQVGDKKEVLLVWGTTEEQCHLWIIEPEVQNPIETITNESSCNYSILTSNNKQYLVHVEAETGRITIYNIAKDDHLSIQETIFLDGLEITSEPQLGESERLFFSAILNDEENIYWVDSETGEQAKYIDLQEGMTFEPVISPNGKYLAYWLLEGVLNSHKCLMGCGAGYYYVIDTETTTQLDLRAFVAFSSPHYNLQWSPSGNFLAFNVTNHNQEQVIIVVDVENGEVIPTDILEGELQGWLSDSEFVYTSMVFFPQYGKSFPRYQVLSVQTHVSRELANFPILDQDNLPFFLDLIDWTDDGKYFVGTTPESGGKDLVIVDASSQDLQISRTHFNHEIRMDPLWSPNGNWIAYRTTDDWDKYLSTGRQGIAITDRIGSVHHTVVLDDMQLQFAWLEH